MQDDNKSEAEKKVAKKKYSGECSDIVMETRLCPVDFLKKGPVNWDHKDR